jgi:hypothetical protein
MYYIHCRSINFYKVTVSKPRRRGEPPRGDVLSEHGVAHGFRAVGEGEAIELLREALAVMEIPTSEISAETLMAAVRDLGEGFHAVGKGIVRVRRCSPHRKGGRESIRVRADRGPRRRTRPIGIGSRVTSKDSRPASRRAPGT